MNPKNLIPDDIDERKRNLALKYFELGSINAAAKALGIAYHTANYWAQADWFKSLVAKRNQESDDEVKLGMARVIKRGVEKLEAMVEHGETVLAKDGSLITKPISARDMALIVAISVDKREKMNAVSSSANSPGEILQKIAEAARKIAIDASGRASSKPTAIDMGEAQLVSENASIDPTAPPAQKPDGEYVPPPITPGKRRGRPPKNKSATAESQPHVTVDIEQLRRAAHLPKRKNAFSEEMDEVSQSVDPFSDPSWIDETLV